MTEAGPDIEGLPAVLAEIAAVAGVDAAWALAQARGGRMVYIPPIVPEGHWLAQVMGREAADRIAAHFSGGGRGARLLVPIGNRALASRQLAALLEQAAREGWSVAQIVEAAGCHSRTVHRWRAARRADARPAEKKPKTRTLFD